MFQYTKREKVESNLDTLDIYDAVSLCHKIGQFNFNIGNNYFLRIYFKPLSSTVKTLIINAEVYNIETEEEVKTNVVSEIDNFRSILSNIVDKIITDINNRNIKVVCFDRDANTYLENGILYAAVYNFNKEKFYSAPSFKEVTLQLYSVNVSNLYDMLIK